MRKDKTVDYVAAKSFMGLLAAKGLIPGSVTDLSIEPDFLDVIEDEIRADMRTVRAEYNAVTAEGLNFFQLMEREGLMKPAANENKKRRFTLRITRPAALGGEMPLTA